MSRRKGATPGKFGQEYFVIPTVAQGRDSMLKLRHPPFKGAAQLRVELVPDPIQASTLACVADSRSVDCQR